MAENPVNRLRGITSRINLVGTDDEIKTQLSLLLGVSELLDVTGKGLDLNFERWIEDFENGFDKWTGKLNPKFAAKNWGVNPTERPKVKILKETKDFWGKEGFYLIEFFPNRKNQETSYLLFGSPLQLMRELMQWMNFHLLENPLDEVIGAIEREPEQFNVRGHPKVKLIFLENPFEFSKRLAKDSKATRGRAQMSFRLMDKTNASMTLAESERLATKIKSKFIKPLFKFTKGKEFYNYIDSGVGQSLQCWARNEVEAKKLFEQTLDLMGMSLQLEKTRKYLSLNPAKTYDDNPGTQIVLGKPVKLDKLRPIVDVEFTMAYLIMDGLRQPIYLIDRRYRHKSLISLA